MAVIQFRSPVNKPLLRKGTPKPVPPDPAAYETFRVTQQYADLDAYFQNKLHLATDIGNFTCGDPVVAMAPGIAWPLKDNATALGAKTDALGVRIDHGSGVSTEYWHLNRVDIASGQQVAAGQQIGIVGDTGLNAVCHCHIEAKRNGIRTDPEPLMFGGFLVVPEEDVLPEFTALGTGVVKAGNNLRAEPNTTSDNYYVQTQRSFDVLGVTKGGSYVVGGKPGDEWVAIRGQKVWFIARPLIEIFASEAGKALFPSGGYTANDLEAAKTAGLAEGRKVGFIDAKTKARVAVEGIAP